MLFGLSNQVVVTFKEENTMTFKQIFLKDYDESSGDSFAVYTQNDVYDHIFYAVEQVSPEENGKAGKCSWQNWKMLKVLYSLTKKLIWTPMCPDIRMSVQNG